MQFPNRVRMALQKTVSFPSSTGPRGGAYLICPYNRVRAILRNTDAISQLDTYGISKNCPVFVPYGAAGLSVFNTPLQLDTCDPSKYRCDPPTGYVRSYGIPIRSLDRRGRGVWEVGRWGLPLAGEVGVNEFGEEEDDDQDYDDEGA